MKRPLFLTGLCFFAAVWAAFSMPQDVPALYLSVAAAVTAALVFALRERIKAAAPLCAALLTFAAAFGFYTLYHESRVAPVLELAGKTVRVEGLVTSVDRGPSSVSYTMKAGFPDYPGIPGDTPVIIRDLSEPNCAEGDVITCRAYLTAADASMWYRSRGILLIGQSPRDFERAPTGAYRFERALLRLRAILERNVYSNLPGESASIVSAMVLGFKNDIEPEVFSAVNRSGTAHLLTVSGLHLSILAAFVLKLFKKLRFPDFLGSAAAISILFLFAGLVGFGSSVLRSFSMTALTLSGRIFSRRADSLSSLGAALIICCVFRPYWTLGFGLWLSAGSTLGIILFSGKLTDFLKKLLSRGRLLADRFTDIAASAAAVSIAAYAFTAPVLLLMSGWLSLVSPVANVLVSPFIPVVILGGMFCAVFTGTAPPVVIISRATDFCASAVILISKLFSRLPFATAAIDESWLLILLAGLCVIVAVLVIFRGGRELFLYALCLVLVCFSVGELSLSLANKNKVELVTLSGRDAALLLRGGEAVVLGTPDAYEISNLLKYLNFRGIKRVSALIATDMGGQINSGLLRLSQEYQIDCVLAPNDAFDVLMLEEALPGSLVYSGGYATLTALGGVKITAELMTSDIHITVGKNEIMKIRGDCDIIEAVDGRTAIFNDGVMVLPTWITPAFEPVGAYLFGESRILLPL